MTRLIGLSLVLLLATPSWATGRFLPGDSVRDRGRAGASVSSERGVNSLQVNPALLGMADNFGFAVGWTLASEASEFTRGGPHVQSLEEGEQLGLNSLTMATPTSNGLSESALSDRLLRAGLVYGFGTSGFRIGLGYTQLPLENHSYLACNPARYRLIHSADQREQISFGMGGNFGKRFAMGLGLHWERLKQVRRFMINTTAASVEGATAGRHIESAGNDHIVDMTGTVPIGFGDNEYVPTASVGLWSRLFAGFEVGVSVALGGTGNSANGSIDVLDLEWRDETDTTSPVFARRGINETSDGTGATMSDGTPLQVRAGMRYQFRSWDLEFEWRMESWSADTQLSASPTANGVGWYNQLADPANVDTSIELGNMGDARALESAQSFHLASDIWLVPDGIALRLGGSMEFSPTTQPDALMYPGPRYGIGAGLSIADRGYAIDMGYLHLFSQATEVVNGQLPIRNIAQRAAETEIDTLTVQNNGTYTTSIGFFGMGIRADVDTFAKNREAQRKAWYQVWSKGTTGFGRGGF